LPLIPGYDIAGVVEKAGAKVTKLKVGDPIYAYVMWGGGYAGYAVATEGEGAAKPKSITFVEAAGVPLAALTAWQALIDAAKLIEEKKIKPIVSQVLPLTEAVKAQEQAATHHTRGKLVLKIADEPK